MSQLIRDLYSMDKNIQEWEPSKEHIAAADNLEKFLNKVKDEISEELYDQLNGAILRNEEECEIRGYEIGLKLGLKLGFEVNK